MTKKVALVHARVSNNNVPPLGLLCIAGFLDAKGIGVKVWDPSPYDNNFIDEIKDFYPDIIGISLMTAEYARAREMVKLLKVKVPNAVYACGGVHVSALPEESLRGLDVDVAVLGEGEITMQELCYSDKDGWSKINGILYLGETGIHRNPARELIEDLDIIPFTGRHLLSSPFNWYLIPPGVIRGVFSLYTTTMITSRGCPYNCLFCASRVIFGRHFRRRSVDNVIEEIRYLQKEYHINGIWFLDDTFTFDREWVHKFCLALIKQRIGLKWSCQTRVDRIDKGLLSLMKLAGCAQLEIGVESGSEKVLEQLDKGISIKELKEKFAQMKQLGLRTMANFMIGSPGENIEDVVATYRLAKYLNPNFIEFNMCIPYPGSALYDLARKNGWIADNPDFNTDWSEHFTNSPVMRVNIASFELLSLRARLQNRFLWRNYSLIMKGFFRYPKYFFILVWSMCVYLKEDFRGMFVLLLSRRVDALIWNFYYYYSKISREHL